MLETQRQTVWAIIAYIWGPETLCLQMEMSMSPEHPQAPLVERKKILCLPCFSKEGHTFQVLIKITER